MGRPRKREPKRKTAGQEAGEPQISTERMIAAIRANKGGIYRAARAIGCSARTIYRRMKESEELVETVSEERNYQLDLSESALFDARDRGEGWAIALHLKTLGKDRGYTEKQIVEQVGKIVVRRKPREVVGE